MCTAATYETEDFYFGRTLDYECSFGEEVVVTPRRFPYSFRNGRKLDEHYAMIGMAHVEEGCPLYYEAVNEKGLGMAGLNFVGNAFYGEQVRGRDNVAFFEFIPWILGQCASLEEARDLLGRIHLTGEAFSSRLPVAQLHWMISGREGSIVVESMKDGLHIHDNPVGVMTNNPPFPLQMFQLNNYMGLSVDEPGNHFSPGLPLRTYSRGMGALGLPGDLSSQSRFVRAAFTRMNAVSGKSERESVSQFFHILGTVDNPRGCCRVWRDRSEGAAGEFSGQRAGGEGLRTFGTDTGQERGSQAGYEITVYTCCCNVDKGIYYYTTYDNHQITGVHMHREDLEGKELGRYSLILEEQIRMQN